MEQKDNRQVILFVIVGLLILAAIIFFLVMIFQGSGAGNDPRGGQNGRGGQEGREGTVTPSGDDGDNKIRPTDDDEDDPNKRPSGGNGGRNGSPTPTPDGWDPNAKPSGGNGGNGENGTPTPTPYGWDPNAKPSGGNGGNGENGPPTPTQDPNARPSGGGGGNGTPTPTTDPNARPSGGGGGNGTPTPTTDPNARPSGGGGGNGTPTPTTDPNARPSGGGGGTSTPTPTPKPGGGGGGGPVPKPTDVPIVYPIDPDDHGADSNLNAYNIAEQTGKDPRDILNFGDERWSLYLNNLFTRVSPDYSVDALNALNAEGMQMFMYMSEIISTDKKEYRYLSTDEKTVWDAVAEDVSKAEYRWQLEEIILKYLATKGENRLIYEASYQQFMNGNYNTNEERKMAMYKSQCYKLVVELQKKWPNKAQGYGWNEALGVVLRNSGSPMAEVVSAADDIQLFMDLGYFFEGKDFDVLSYEDKLKWFAIEADVNAATTTYDLEEIIAKYHQSSIWHTYDPTGLKPEEIAKKEAEINPMGAVLDACKTETERRNKFLEPEGYYATYVLPRVNYYPTLKEGKNLKYATWDEALASILKSRTTFSGTLNAGEGTLTPEELLGQ
ncbi:MAG: hypothetical protein IKO10_09165 [Lachnospiraceae bacterium]|nr:hypothetical protein [Lachnospiraceae bacterium]